jgi:DNA-binding LytR/AlgR family response regulator
MGHLEKLLNPHVFVRVSRFALANIGRIRGIEPGPKGKLYLLLKTGAKLLSSLSLKEVQSRLQLR